MKKNCAFTICTRSYLGLAEALKKSFLKYNDDFDFYIVFSDFDDDKGDGIIDADQLVSKYLPNNALEEMKYKYDLTEYCTSIKPFSILSLFDKGYDLVCYFDPDILFFSKFCELYDNEKSAYLTPHILTKNNIYPGDENEEINYLRCGIYNCGFVAFRNNTSGRSFVEWWAAKLEKYAYADYGSGLFTDQKWMDYAPCYFDSDDICIVKNAGCNVAPWNFFERQIIEDDGMMYVKLREGDIIQKMCFAHISAYNYSELQDGIINHKYRTQSKYSDTEILLKRYGKALQEVDAKKYFNIEYKYLRYSNGVIITKLHRRMYRTLLEQDVHYTNLFSSNSKYYSLLKSNKLLSKSNINVTKAQNVSGYNKKIKMLKVFYKVMFRLLGVDKYCEFIRALELYSRCEKSTWLIKDE